MKYKKRNTTLEGPSTDQYLEALKVTYSVLEPVVHEMISALQLPQGSCGLDVGCGIGQAVLSLAEAVGPTGQVTGLDITPEFLDYAKVFAQKAGLEERVTFRQGDFNKLPFEDNSFDWVWSKDCVGYQIDELQHALKELVRVVKPGGIIILILWSSQMLLPGYPILEAHLNATSSGIAPFVKGMKSELHFFRLLGHLHEVGLKERSAKTFVGDVHAPFSDAIRDALVSFFKMRWPDVESELSKEDWAEYQRLCEPGSPDFILNIPDYYAFFTYSLFRGKVAKK